MASDDLCKKPETTEWGSRLHTHSYFHTPYGVLPTMVGICVSPISLEADTNIDLALASTGPCMILHGGTVGVEACSTQS